jgi:TRAP-type C4-dicarboxylate transport system permease small subunit
MAGLNAIGSVWVAALTLLICADILGRVLFASPLVGVPEIVKVSIVAIVWLQIPHTLKAGGHLRSDVLLRYMPGRVRAAVDLFAFVLGAVVFALLVYSGWDTMIQAWEMGEFEGEEPVRVPTYPLRSIVLLGAALTALQFVLMAAGAARRLTRQSAEAP